MQTVMRDVWRTQQRIEGLRGALERVGIFLNGVADAGAVAADRKAPEIGRDVHPLAVIDGRLHPLLPVRRAHVAFLIDHDQDVCTPWSAAR